MTEKAVVKKITTLSPVWIVPLVACVIALWLAIQAQMQKGTTIHITFASASDIIPGQTHIKLKNVTVGEIKDITLSDDLSRVEVIAEIDAKISKHLSENTRFWVVTPRISATGVSNLGTLISGVYIVMDPGEKGEFATKFRGLDESPSLRSDETGTHYVLRAETLGSLDVGSPVHYRQVRVGEVTGYKLSQNRKHVDINFFIRAPYDQIVQKRSRFWDVSGFGVSVGADGLKAKMASLASLIAGGVEFDNSATYSKAESASEGHRFYLYPDRESVLEERFTIKYYYLLKFSGSIRGLKVGAPVEFKGIKVGEVVDVVLDNANNEEKSLHVYISMEPQRFDPEDEPTRQQVDARLRGMVENGLKAQMNTANLVTGSKFIDLIFSDTPMPEDFIVSSDYTELPTTNDSVSQLTQKLDGVLDTVSEIPFKDIGRNLSASFASLKNILSTLETKNTAEKMDDVIDALDKTLEQAQSAIEESEQLLSSLNTVTAPDSATKFELDKMMGSVADAATSLKKFMDELNRHPNALLRGKKKHD